MMALYSPLTGAGRGSQDDERLQIVGLVQDVGEGRHLSVAELAARAARRGRLAKAGIRDCGQRSG